MPTSSSKRALSQVEGEHAYGRRAVMVSAADRRLWYAQPAHYFTQALPLGNGRLGAMVFGGVLKERIALNEDSLWSGPPMNSPRPQALPAFLQAQQLVAQGKVHEAEALLEQDFNSEFTQAYMPLGDLHLSFEHGDDFNEYERSLDLESATSKLSYRSGGTRFTREAFVSAPDQVLVLRLQADAPGALHFTATLSSPLRGQLSAQAGCLQLLGQCPAGALPDYLGREQPLYWADTPETRGIRFCALLQVVSDGSHHMTDHHIEVRDATQATLLVSCRSDFAGWNQQPGLAKLPYIKPAQEDLAQARAQLPQLFTRHLAEYQAYFHRLSLRLAGNSHHHLPTDQRLRVFEQDPSDIGLVCLLFDYGRYLLICSSRPGSQAANLQGIWNESTTPPWSSNYTANINLQMNYWPALPLNLAEMAQPLHALIRDLSRSGALTAQEYYGAGGFVCHHNTDLWRHSRPVGQGVTGSTLWAFWNLGAAWLCAHLYEHWRFTNDAAFLWDSAWPLCAGAARFCLDILQEDGQGGLLHCPSTSPENQYQYQGKKAALATHTAMSTAILRELFGNCLEMGQQVKANPVFLAELADALARLPEFEIGADGRLLEWDQPFEEIEPTHRHVSHLYGLYPGRLISKHSTPALAEACRQSLLTRGIEGTGWSLGWKLCLWARLGDSEMALSLIHSQLRSASAASPQAGERGGSYDNLFGAHPPFQIDGNFGYCAGIADMLLQNDAQGLYLLPALPASWPSGEVCGLRAWGGIQVDITWKEGRLRAFTLSASQSATILIHLPDGSSQRIQLEANQPLHRRL